jgi:anti-sigma B factor antagonist
MSGTVLKLKVRAPSEISDGTLVLDLDGEIDIMTAPILEEKVTSFVNEGRSFITLDLSRVTFLDSAGISVLLVALRRCTDAGGQLRLVSLRSKCAHCPRRHGPHRRLSCHLRSVNPRIGDDT